MNRFLALKKGANASLSSSMVSNIGYETANDDSLCSSNASMYYSINDKTLENPANPGHDVSNDQTMHTIVESNSPTVLHPIAENSTDLFSPKSRHRNLACASTPMQLADMKTPDSPILYKSSRTTGTVRRNLLTVSQVVMEVIDTDEGKMNSQDETIRPVTPIMVVTSPLGVLSVPVVPVCPVVAEEPTKAEKENVVPNAGGNGPAELKSKSTLSNAFRRSKRISMAAPVPSLPAMTAAPVTRTTRRTMAPPKPSLLAIPEIVLIASDKPSTDPTIPKPRRRMTIAPQKPIIDLAAPAPMQRHALRKTISKQATPQRRSVRSSLGRQSIMAKPRTPAARALRSKTPQKGKPQSRPSMLPPPKSPFRMTRRQSNAQSQHSPGSSTTTLGQTSFTCNVCSKQFLQLSTLKSHQRNHPTMANGLSAPNPTIQTNKCRHCDKSFALNKALRSHLELHCTKITANERRKLMAAPTVPDIRIKRTAERPAVLDAAHSGVYRTPNKQLKCNTCQKTFLDKALFLAHRTTHSVQM